MALPSTFAPAPVTEEAFLEDRQHFWAGFMSFTTKTVIGIVVLLLAMLVFLV